MMDLTQNKVAVVGLGRTGRAVARFLRREGAAVHVTDDAAPAGLAEAIDEVRSLGGVFHGPEDRDGLFRDAALCIASPGVPWDAPVLAAARSRGIETLSELELSSRFVRGTLLAVTGTNGKSTTTELIAHLLRACGLRSVAGGNLGRPLCELLDEDAPDQHLVVECSSFQLQGCTTFHPRVAVFLNFSPNHLDHHRDLDEYLACKRRMFRAMGPRDVAVYNAEDPAVRESLQDLRVQALPFGTGPCAEAASTGLWLHDDRIWTDLGGTARPWLPVEEIPVPGRHNVENVMAATGALLALGLPLDRVRRGLHGFRALPHRLEPVAEHAGVRFVNDSKATNVEAVRAALESGGGGIHLILGGRDKGGDWTGLRPVVQARVRGLYLLGESAGLIASALEGTAPMRMCASMEEAVESARDEARPGEVVLLSPGCSSFDMFRDYRERGETFAAAARSLEPRQIPAANGGTA